MLERLADLEREFEAVEARLADPQVLSDPNALRDLSRRHKELDAVVSRYREYRRAQDDLSTAREMLVDASGADRDVLRAETDQAEESMSRLEEELRVLLLPRDPNAGKNVIVEIRGAEGGEEANLFARDLFQMYSGHATRRSWKLEMLG